MILPNSDVYVVRAAIREWVSNLARNDYNAAASLLTALPGLGVNYDAMTIRSAIGRYSPDYREVADDEKEQFMPSVTDLADMTDRSGENMVIYCVGDSESPIIDYDLPLDGKWSDLTAQFRIINLEGGFGLGLQDIRVF